jgi:hypothetical protein
LPTWIRLTREGFTFKAERSTDGVAWRALTDDNPAASSVNIAMTDPVYIGLVVCSHVAGQFAEATYSNVQIVGNVNPTGPFTTSQDIGIASNGAEPLYVAISNRTGAPAVVVHENANAATIDTWTEWVIPLSAFADQGVVLTDVDRIAIGLGTRGNMTVPDGSGKMYFDDIRLYKPREAAE